MKKIKKLSILKKQQPENKSPVMPLYKPKTLTQQDIQQGFSNATEKVRNQRMIQGQNQGQKIDIRPSEPYGSPRFGKPQVPNYWGPQQPMQQPPQPQPQQQEQTEPYWTAEEWESWAFQLYHQYTETQKFLPEWFIEAIKAEEDN